VIAIDLATHKVRWTFQEVAHDVWDLDVPGSPMLTRIDVEGHHYDVVTTVTKMGNTLLLDRATGKPIHDFRRRRAPQSRMANDHMGDYQPDVELPEPLISLPWDPSRITQVSPEKRAFVEAQFSGPGTIYGRFRAPELNKDLVTFGVHGGAEWHGATVDPDGTVYVPVNAIPWVLRVYLLGDAGAGNAPVYQAQCASCHLPSRNGQFTSVGEAARLFIPSLHGYTLLDENKQHFTTAEFQKRPGHTKVATTQEDLDQIWKEFVAMDESFFKNGKASLLYHWRQLLDQDSLPGSAPPWGKVAAVNLVTGRKLWEVPLGEKLINGQPQETGSASYGGLLGTAGGLLFVVGTDDKQIRAIDKRTGTTLWKHVMDAAGSSPPISFEIDGKQYVAVIATGGKFHNFVDKANKLYVFGL
jgi:quinoprotein glucose dehydrogenase